MAKPHGGLLKGMSTKSPSAPDGKITSRSGSVNNETTRSGTAPTPKTLGPRNA